MGPGYDHLLYEHEDLKTNLQHLFKSQSWPEPSARAGGAGKQQEVVRNFVAGIMEEKLMSKFNKNCFLYCFSENQ